MARKSVHEKHCGPSFHICTKRLKRSRPDFSKIINFFLIYGNNIFDIPEKLWNFSFSYLIVGELFCVFFFFFWIANWDRDGLISKPRKHFLNIECFDQDNQKSIIKPSPWSDLHVDPKTSKQLKSPEQTHKNKIITRIEFTAARRSKVVFYLTSKLKLRSWQSPKLSFPFKQCIALPRQVGKPIHRHLGRTATLRTRIVSFSLPDVLWAERWTQFCRISIVCSKLLSFYGVKCHLIVSLDIFGSNKSDLEITEYGVSWIFSGLRVLVLLWTIQHRTVLCCVELDTHLIFLVPTFNLPLA